MVREDTNHGGKKSIAPVCVLLPRSVSSQTELDLSVGIDCGSWRQEPERRIESTNTKFVLSKI